MKERTVTHVTESQLLARHGYCVTVSEIQAQTRRIMRIRGSAAYMPKNTTAVCDHPEDGICPGAGGSVAEEQLKIVNDRLAGVVTPAQRERRAVKEAEAARPKKPLPEGLRRWLAAKKMREATA